MDSGSRIPFGLHPVKLFLLPTGNAPSPPDQASDQRQAKQTHPKQPAPADGPLPMGCCLATRCQEPQGSQSEGAWGSLASHHLCFQRLLFYSGFPAFTSIQTSRDNAWSGPATLVWPWTHCTKQILGLNIQLRPLVSACSGLTCL